MENKESQVKDQMDSESLAMMVSLNIPPEPPPTFPSIQTLNVNKKAISLAVTLVLHQNFSQP